MVFKIEKWDPASIDAHPRILLIGRSGSGKSVALRDCLSYLADRTDLCLLFSPTTESLDAFRKVAPPSWVYQGGLNLELVQSAFEPLDDADERSLNLDSVLRMPDVVCDELLDGLLPLVLELPPLL